jgi:hypothetical protein
VEYIAVARCGTPVPSSGRALRRIASGSALKAQLIEVNVAETIGTAEVTLTGHAPSPPHLTSTLQPAIGSQVEPSAVAFQRRVGSNRGLETAW